MPVNTQQIPATIPVTQDPTEKIVFKDRIINNTPNVNLDGLNIGIPLPNVYSRTPLNYYKVNPNYIDPRYLNVEDQLNQVVQGQRAVQNNLGSRTTSDISNILQSQINAYKQNQSIYSNKYNYDAAQDAQAQQFNAQAKTQADQYNQSSWFQQLEDPIRRRESAIGDQQLLDMYKGQERFDKSIAYQNTKDLIDATYSQYQNMTPEQVIANLPAKNFENYLLANYQPKKSKSGGKVKIKPSLKKKK